MSVLWHEEKSMLDVLSRENTWIAPKLSEQDILKATVEARKINDRVALLTFITIDPYIDLLLVEIIDPEDKIFNVSRFTFHEGLSWSTEEEEQFERKCLKSEYPLRFCSADFDHIYKYYSELHPQWHLKRYYTHEMRLLDHIHHCMTQNTIKELLYKSGVDELAVRAPEAHEINLLATNPSEIYDHVPMRVIRAVNTEYGAELLANKEYQEYLRQLNSQYPDIFKDPLNDAQCEYLLRLKKGNLTNPEIYRLFLSKKPKLTNIWIHAQFLRFMYSETAQKTLNERAKALVKVDPFYATYLPKLDSSKISELLHYLTTYRKDLDKDIRRSNRKRDYNWQERYDGYVIRYPQTINDFCKESIYMSNCLMTYLEAYIENDTTIMFLRREDSIYEPFITLEIYDQELTQAYHRFNTECSEEEWKWIREFSLRHDITCSQ